MPRPAADPPKENASARPIDPPKPAPVAAVGGAGASPAATGPAVRAKEGVELKPVNAADLGSVWSLVREACGGNRRLSILMNEMQLVSVGEQTAVVRVAEEVRAAVASTEKDLAAAMAAVLGREVRLELSGGSVGAPGTPAAQGDEGAVAAGDPGAVTPRTPITDHPLVRHAVELFNARVISVQPRRTKPDSSTPTN